MQQTAIVKAVFTQRNTFHYFTQLEADESASERERSGEKKKEGEKKGVRDKIPRGWNKHEFPRAIVLMHLYPCTVRFCIAGLCCTSVPSLLPSVFLSSLPSPLLPHRRRLASGSSSFISLFRSLPRHEIAPWTFGWGKKEEEEEATFLPKETRACRALLYPYPSSLSDGVPRNENDQKDQVHPAEMHSRFPIRICDKNVTLLERCVSTVRPVC